MSPPRWLWQRLCTGDSGQRPSVRNSDGKGIAVYSRGCRDTAPASEAVPTLGCRARPISAGGSCARKCFSAHPCSAWSLPMNRCGHWSRTRCCRRVRSWLWPAPDQEPRCRPTPCLRRRASLHRRESIRVWRRVNRFRLWNFLSWLCRAVCCGCGDARGHIRIPPECRWRWEPLPYRLLLWRRRHPLPDRSRRCSVWLRRASGAWNRRRWNDYAAGRDNPDWVPPPLCLPPSEAAWERSGRRLMQWQESGVPHRVFYAVCQFFSFSA